MILIFINLLRLLLRLFINGNSLLRILTILALTQIIAWHTQLEALTVALPTARSLACASLPVLQCRLIIGDL